MTSQRPVIITSDLRGSWWIQWPDSVEGYREGPYSDRAGCSQRIREEGYGPCNCDFHRGMTAEQAWSTLP